MPKKVPVEVTQEWLNTYRQKICTRPWVFIVEGDAEAEVTVDEGGDGIPDEGWTKKDISAWLTERGRVQWLHYKSQTTGFGRANTKSSSP